MRYHFGLGIGHAYSHSEFAPVPSSISEIIQEPQTPMGSRTSQIPAPQPLPEQPSAVMDTAEEADGDTSSDVDSEFGDEKSLDLDSYEGSEGEGSLDWDEELIAEEMYEE